MDGVANFGSHALLQEGTELALIVDLDEFLRPIGRVGDVELHLDEGARSRWRREVVGRSRKLVVVGDSFRSFRAKFWWCSETHCAGRD